MDMTNILYFVLASSVIIGCCLGFTYSGFTGWLIKILTKEDTILQGDKI